MVLDGNGKQMPDLQGKYDEVKEQVMTASDEQTEFSHATWGGPRFKVKRKDW